MVRLEKQAARVTELAVQQVRSRGAEEQEPPVRRSSSKRIEAENRINFLVGRYPQAVKPKRREVQGALCRR